LKELSDCRVLIVDDVRANVDILVQALRDEYKLSVALGGQQALDAVAKAPPDLVLLDIMMPDIDGYEVCRRLRDDPLLDDLRIIMLTSSDDKHAAFEAGVDDYLNKDVDLLNLPNRVKLVLEM
jgi:CheY-like chemotaxis protein